MKKAGFWFWFFIAAAFYWGIAGNSATFAVFIVGAVIVGKLDETIKILKENK